MQANRILFLMPLLLALVSSAAAQTLTLAGQVVNAATGAPVPFASVGLLGRNAGSVAGKQGTFAFTVPADTVAATDKVIISCVGFESVERTVADFGSGQLLIRLAPKGVALREVAVSGEKPKHRVLGNQSRAPIFAHIEMPNKAKGGGEIGRIVRADKDKNFYLDDLNFYIEQNTHHTIKLRLILYDIQNGLPSNVISTQDVVFDVPDGGGKRWVKVDLRKYGIVVEGKESFAATLQWIKGERGRPHLNKYHEFNIPASFINPLLNTVLYRGGSQGKWYELGADMSFYFNTTYFRREGADKSENSYNAPTSSSTQP